MNPSGHMMGERFKVLSPQCHGVSVMHSGHLHLTTVVTGLARSAFRFCSLRSLIKGWKNLIFLGQ